MSRLIAIFVQAGFKAAEQDRLQEAIASMDNALCCRGISAKEKAELIRIRNMMVRDARHQAVVLRRKAHG